MKDTIRRRSLTTTLALAGVVLGSVLCTLPAKARASWDGYVRDFIVFNETGSSIIDLRISDVGQRTYGPNLLWGRVGDGGSVFVSPAGSRGYCLYDVRYVLSDGTTLSRDRMNVCEEGAVVLLPEGWAAEG